MNLGLVLVLDLSSEDDRLPDCFPHTSEHVRFYLLVLFFFHFLVFGSMW